MRRVAPAPWIALFSLAAPRLALATPHPRAASRVVALLEQIAARVRATRYAHVTRVEPAHGVYEFDCSGMVAYVLARPAT